MHPFPGGPTSNGTAGSGNNTRYLPPTVVEYGGVWVSFFPDLSGMTTFATPDEAFEHALDRPCWVTFLAYGVDLAELIEQIRKAVPGHG